MTIRDRIAEHGGISAVHVTPVTDADRKIVGWQNVVVCRDGHREYPTIEEQRVLAECDPVPRGLRA